MRSLFFIVFLTIQLVGEVHILTPLDGLITEKSMVYLQAQGSVNRGFLLVQDQIVPIRESVVSVPISLQVGKNKIVVHVLDEYRKLQFDLMESINIYRSVSINDDVTDYERVVLTELMSRYHLSLLDHGNARMDMPILKKDLYAFLMWFFLDRSRSDVLFQYSDMAVYNNYLQLYSHHPMILPEPILTRFYPDAFVTTQEMLELLFLLKGEFNVISDGYLLNHSFSVPDRLKPFVAFEWKSPTQFVTRREAFSIFSRYHERSFQQSKSSVVIDWPRYSNSSFQGVSGIGDMVYTQFQGIIKKIRSIRSNKIPIKPNLMVAPNQSMITSHSSNKIVSPKLDTLIVLSGDSIQKISKRHYGNSKYWREIVALNQLEVKQVTVNQRVVSTVDIFPGQELLMPDI